MVMPLAINTAEASVQAQDGIMPKPFSQTGPNVGEKIRKIGKFCSSVQNYVPTQTCTSRDSTVDTIRMRGVTVEIKTASGRKESSR